jgi:serine protease inhibitor
MQRMRPAKAAAYAFLFVTWVLAGCAGDGSPAPQALSDPSTAGSSFVQASAVQQAQRDDAAVNPALVAADNALGIDLLNLLSQNQSTNISISPISIALALQMLYNGAAGTTQQAIAQALQLQGLTASEVDVANAALQASLINPDPDVQMTIANSLWMHLSDNPVLLSFTQINQTYYAAQIGDLAGAPADVNQWVANATGGLITQILPANFNPALTILVIANALYFKGAWSAAFDPAQTTWMPFTRVDGTQVSCQMMSQTGSFQYLQAENVQVIRLPYGQKNRMSMIVMLPESGVTLDDILGSLTSTELDSWIAQLSTARVSVGLPRFTTSYNTSLVPPLTTLGMGIAFSQNANLSALAPATQVSFVQHATQVQVDETGTVAAAATTVGVGPTVVPLTVTMTMDHPFLYAIRDDETGALLFIGLMFDPTST